MKNEFDANKALAKTAKKAHNSSKPSNPKLVAYLAELDAQDTNNLKLVEWN